MAILEFVMLAALAAGQQPTYPEARRCAAVLDVAWVNEPDEARKQLLLSAATDWGQLSGKLARDESRDDRRVVMAARDEADRAKAQWASDDPKVREGLLKEIEQCLAARPARAA